MRLARRTLLASLALPAAARAQEAWPTRSITLVAPFAPGGPVDNAARPFAEAFGRVLGRPVVVENRGGAGGMIGTRAVAQARPDGYTMVVGAPAPLVLGPAANPDAPDLLQQLVPVGLIAISPQILVVNNDLPARSLAEYVALARARPGQLNYGSAGIGTTPHLAMELLGQLEGLRFEHVPYRGTGAALPDLVGGKIDALFGDISAVMPLVEGGRIRALAVTGAERSPLAPSVPSAAELGMPTLKVRNFQAVLLPAGTPQPIVQRAEQAMIEALRSDSLRAALARQGQVASDGGAAALTDFLREERAIWTPVVRAIGLTLQ
jgi:tripartite-type tricarboxylate transporter receptor subunit TctC